MTFDVDSFLNSSVTGALDTKITPCPQGEYQGIIDKVVPRQWQSKDGTQSGIALDIFWNIEDSAVRQVCSRDNVQVKQGLMLDLNPQGGLDLSKGKNVPLGRLREAVGKNSDSEAFSFNMLPGLMAKVNVSHRVVGEDTYPEVKAVAKL